MKFLCTVHPCHGLKGPGVCSRPYKGVLSTCIQYTHSRTVARVINGYLVINGVTLQKQLQGKYLQLIWWQDWTWKDPILLHQKVYKKNPHLSYSSKSNNWGRLRRDIKMRNYWEFVHIYALTHTYLLELWPWVLDLCCFRTGAFVINLPSKASFINHFWSLNKPWGCFNKWFFT